MTYGLRFKNTAGTILIDDTYSNHALSQKGTITSGYTSYGGYDPTFHFGLTFSGVKFPILALQCSSGPVTAIGGLNLAAGTASFDILFDSSVNGTSPTIKWFLFDDVDHLGEPTDLWGVRFKTPAGKLTFHSGYGYLDMVSQTTSPAVQTLESGRQYATIVTRQDMTAGVLVSGTNHLLTYTGKGGKVVSNQVSWGNINIKTFPPGQTLENYANAGCFSVVDVTAL